ncbi:hypothetical protein NKH16_13115 [Mesorhizobium sp. M1307]|uniref:hypothetical protein n=1 Tax=Mesorhizobium sp. M1307 TaxID=2957079 RepID=UPI00333E0EA1
MNALNCLRSLLVVMVTCLAAAGCQSAGGQWQYQLASHEEARRMRAAGKMPSSIECMVDDLKPKLGPRFAARVQYEPNPKNLDWDYIVARTLKAPPLKQRGLKLYSQSGVKSNKWGVTGICAIWRET